MEDFDHLFTLNSYASLPKTSGNLRGVFEIRRPAKAKGQIPVVSGYVHPDFLTFGYRNLVNNLTRFKLYRVK